MKVNALRSPLHLEVLSAGQRLPPWPHPGPKSNNSNVKILNAIYGLKQSTLEWHKELRNAILSNGWKSSEYDICMYYCPAEDGRIAVLVTFVGDILHAGDYEEDV